MRLFHRRIAEALLSEAERSEDPAQATAKAGAHFEQAGLTHLAIQQYQRAAEESFARFANQEAVQLLNQALGLVEKMSHQNSTPARAAQRPLETGDPLGIVTLSLRALIEQAHEYTTG
jgi:predicted ATPase